MVKAPIQLYYYRPVGSRQVVGSCINFDFNFPITYSAERPDDRPHGSLVEIKKFLEIFLELKCSKVEINF